MPWVHRDGRCEAVGALGGGPIWFTDRVGSWMGSVTATPLGLSAGLLPPIRVELQLTQSLLQSCRILSAGVHLDACVGATELFFLEFLDLGRVRNMRL